MHSRCNIRFIYKYMIRNFELCPRTSLTNPNKNESQENPFFEPLPQTLVLGIVIKISELNLKVRLYLPFNPPQSKDIFI